MRLLMQTLMEKERMYWLAPENPFNSLSEDTQITIITTVPMAVKTYRGKN